MKAKDYLTTWLNKKYGGSPEIGDWTPEDVVEFAEDFANINSPFTKSEISVILMMCEEKNNNINKESMLAHELKHLIDKLNNLNNKN